MGWTGSPPNQVFTRTDGTRTGTEVWQEAEGAGVNIVSSDHDVHDQDQGDGINECLKKDGGNQPTADIPWNNNLITGYGDPDSRTNAARVAEVQDGAHMWGGTAGGTADALTLSLSPSISSYTTGLVVWFIANAANTGTATLNVDGQGATTLKKTDGTTDLAAGDLVSGRLYGALYDGTSFQVINLDTAGTVDTDSLADDAVTNAKIADDAVDTAKIADDAVNTARIADSAVTLAKVQDIATDRLLGRSTAGSGVVEELAADDARAILGLATGDSPQIAGINLGHASDTTLARESAGVVSVEGDILAFRDRAPNEQTGTNYTLVLSDAGGVVEANNGGANTVTIPLESSVNFPVGTRLRVIQTGAGTTTIEGASGVDVNGEDAGSIEISSQFTAAYLFKSSSDDWVVFNLGGGVGTDVAFLKAVATDGGSSIEGHDNIEAGDLLVLFDYVRTPSGGVPSGFTTIHNVTDGVCEAILSYKIADGTEAGAQITGLSGASDVGKVLLVFRTTFSLSTVTPNDGGSELNNGNPSAQNANASGATTPVIVIGAFGSESSFSSFTFSPTHDLAFASPSNQQWLALRVYNESPEDVTVDMGDVDTRNVLMSTYLELS